MLLRSSHHSSGSDTLSSVNIVRARGFEHTERTIQSCRVIGVHRNQNCTIMDLIFDSGCMVFRNSDMRQGAAATRKSSNNTADSRSSEGAEQRTCCQQWSDGGNR